MRRWAGLGVAKACTVLLAGAVPRGSAASVHLDTYARTLNLRRSRPGQNGHQRCSALGSTLIVACVILCVQSVSVSTGTLAADVRIEVHGAEGRSGSVALCDSPAVTPFKRGHCDDFKLRCRGVGQVQALSLVCEAPEEQEKAWFLDWIAIQAAAQAPWVYFSFNCWIPSNQVVTRRAAFHKLPSQGKHHSCRPPKLADGTMRYRGSEDP